MSLRIPTPAGVPPDVERALDEVIAPIQAWADKQVGGSGWVSLKKSDLVGIRGDTGVTFTVAETLSNSSVPGYLRYLRFGRLVVVDFQIAFTPSGTTASVNFLLPQFGVVGRTNGLGYDSNGNTLKMSLGTPFILLGSTAIAGSTAVLRLEKLSGGTFPASAQAVTGHILGEVTDLETFIT